MFQAIPQNFREDWLEKCSPMAFASHMISQCMIDRHIHYSWFQVVITDRNNGVCVVNRSKYLQSILRKRKVIQLGYIRWLKYCITFASTLAALNITRICFLRSIINNKLPTPYSVTNTICFSATWLASFLFLQVGWYSTVHGTTNQIYSCMWHRHPKTYHSACRKVKDARSN